MNDPECDRLDDAIADYAVGSLDGRERARVAAHLQNCGRCRLALHGYDEALDYLTALLPAIEPPAGFEARVLSSGSITTHADVGSAPDRAATTAIQDEPKISDARSPAIPVFRRSRIPRGVSGRRTLRYGLPAAAIVSGVVGIAVLAPWGNGAAPATGPPKIVAPQLSVSTDRLYEPLIRGSTEIGKIYAYPGSPTWISIVIDQDPRSAPPGSLTMTCELRHRDGTVSTIGPLTVTDGNGAWSGPIRTSPYDLITATIVGDADTPYATADLTAR